MSYNIRSLSNIAFQKEKKYFFDANIWLKILKPQFNLSNRDNKYLEFFDKFCKHQNHPKVIITSLLLSEIINRYLRDVTFHKFCTKKGVSNPDKSYYKEVYRISEEFIADYYSLLEDIKAYEDFYILESDGLGSEIKQKNILTSPPRDLDFNDNYYYQLAKARNYILVTDDKDFFVEEVEIFTYNAQLIDRANAALKIKK